MLCCATGGIVRSAGRFCGTTDAGTEVVATAFRPVSRDSQPPVLGAASGNGPIPSTADCGTTDTVSSDEGRASLGIGFVIFWITNLCRGERRDDTTLNRAPLVEHLNS